MNGYIAKSDGSVDWLETLPKPENSDYGYQEFYDSIDTCIMGNNTYKQINNWDIEFPYTNKKNYVFTKTPRDKDDQHAQFVWSEHVDFAKKLKKQKGKDIWLMGGGKLNSTFLDSKLIDEVRLFVMPIILDNGIPIFNNLKFDNYLKLDKIKSYESGAIELIYKPQ
jgi:dihydrofolate reductase